MLNLNGISIKSNGLQINFESNIKQNGMNLQGIHAGFTRNSIEIQKEFEWNLS